MKYYLQYHFHHIKKFSAVFLFMASIIFYSDTAASETQINTAHNQITESYAISPKRIYSDEISAHDAAYYRISSGTFLEIHIKIKKGSAPVPKLLDRTGNPINFHKQHNPSGMIFTVNLQNQKENGYVFFSLKNPTAQDIKYSLWYTPYEKEQHSTPKPTPKVTPRPKTTQRPTKTPTQRPTQKPEKRDVPKPAQPPATRPVPQNPLPEMPKPEENFSFYAPQGTEQEKHTPAPPKKQEKLTLKLSPHFIHLKPKQKKRLTLSLLSSGIKVKKNSSQKINSKNQFIWLSSDEKTAYIKKEMIYAKKRGIVIIYVKHKKRASLISSVLIRVY